VVGIGGRNLIVGAVAAVGLAVPASAIATPAPETSIGSGTVVGTQFNVSVTGGPFGQDPSGSLEIQGAYNFTATPTCMNIADNAGVVGFRIDDGPQAGEGFIAGSEPDASSRSVQFSAVVAEPPTACPPDDAPAPPDTVDAAGGGSVNEGQITDGGGPANPLPLSRQQFSTSAAPGSIAQAANGTIWFTEPSTNQLVSISDDDAGTMHEYDVPTANAGLSSIAPDLSGSGMWFTESKAEQVGHVSRTGAVVGYPVNSGAQPTAIAGDSAGGAWFSEGGADRVAHISEAGNVSEYRLPTGAADPTAISADGDGGAWFVEKAAKQIGYVDAAGNVVEYSLPDGYAVTAIAADGNGGAWFLEPSANTVGYIDSSGDIDQYPIPTANAAAQGIASGTGPDGSTEGAWLSETGAGQLGFISSTGQFSEFTITGAAPGAIAFAPSIDVPPVDGYSEYEGVWWTDATASDVGFATYPLNVASAQSLVPPPPAPSEVTVALARRVTVRGGRIPLTLRCQGGGGQCLGRVSVTDAMTRAASVTAPFATASFSIAGHHHRSLILRMDRRAKRLLRSHRRGVPVTIDISTRSRFTASARPATLRLG
jgi:virginiamycin B lyase